MLSLIGEFKHTMRFLATLGALAAVASLGDATEVKTADGRKTRVEHPHESV